MTDVEKVMELVEDVRRRSVAAMSAADQGKRDEAMSHQSAVWTAVDAIRTALSAGGWRAIAEAPRDGTEILAFADEVVRMKWVEGEGYGLWIYADVTLADVCPDAIQPTHWQPLPPPPITAEDG